MLWRVSTSTTNVKSDTLHPRSMYSDVVHKWRCFCIMCQQLHLMHTKEKGQHLRLSSWLNRQGWCFEREIESTKPQMLNWSHAHGRAHLRMQRNESFTVLTKMPISLSFEHWVGCHLLHGQLQCWELWQRLSNSNSNDKLWWHDQSHILGKRRLLVCQSTICQLLGCQTKFRKSSLHKKQ